MPYETPQEAEDAYYDALETGDAQAMTQVWEASEETVCLLPMAPLAIGRQVDRLWRAIFEQGGRFDLQVHHLVWIEHGDMAIHLIEERTQPNGTGKTPPPIYATNVFRRSADGRRLLVHQNSPTPPPPPAVPSASRTAIA